MMTANEKRTQQQKKNNRKRERERHFNLKKTLKFSSLKKRKKIHILTRAQKERVHGSVFPREAAE